MFKMSSKPTYLIFSFMLITSVLSAQLDTLEFGEAEGSNLIKLLPPLSLLIDSAMANSPEMTSAEASLARSEYEVQIGNKDWSEIIAFSGRYTYGQFVANDGVGIGFSQPAGGFQVFAGFRVPLSYFTSRSERMGVLKAEMEMEKQTKRRVEMNVREQVIATYNDLILLQRLINISAEARESATLQYQMAESRFRKGELTLDELGSATDMRASFATEYEKLRAQFSQVYAELERLVGTPFSKFPTQ